jgi:hypothetical protein
MSVSTTYEVSLKYKLDNQATRGVHDFADELSRAHGHAEGLGSKIAGLGALVVGAFGAEKAGKALIGFNRDVENAKISLTSMIEGGFGTSFEFAQKEADQLYNTFQKFSMQTPVTTAELLDFGRNVAMSVTAAGGGFQDLIDVTEKGVIASKAWGLETTQTSMQIGEVLQGNIRTTDVFAQRLSAMSGKSLEEMRKMSSGERLGLIQKVFSSDAMKDATSSFSTSFSGVLSTLEDKLQILAGKIGLPLFKAITKEIGDWNTWIDKNSVQIERFAETVGGKLVSAFGMVKDAFAFIADHASTLIKIGEVWAAVSIGRSVGGMLGATLGGVMGPGMALASARGFKPQYGPYRNPEEMAGMTSAPGTISGAKGMIGAIGPALGALAGGYMIGKEISETLGIRDALREAIDPNIVRLERLEKSLEMFDDGVKRSHASLIAKFGDGIASTGVSANKDAALQMWRNQINVLGDINSGRLTGNAPNKGVANATMKDALRGVGFSPDAVDKLYGVGDDDIAVRKEEIEHLKKLVDALQGQQTLGQGAGAVLYGGAFVQLTEYQQKTLNVQQAQVDVMTYIMRSIQGGVKLDIGEVLKILQADSADPTGKKKTGAMSDKPKVNVTIHRIEVQSDDPDRFAFGLVRSFRDAAKNPSSAVSTLREG